MQHGQKVVLLANGNLVCDEPIDWRAALEGARASTEPAPDSEAEQIAADQGLLLRAGIPVGLSDHPKIRDAAATIAAHDRTLRRAMPGGVKSTEHVPRPSLHQRDPS